MKFRGAVRLILLLWWFCSFQICIWSDRKGDKFSSFQQESQVLQPALQKTLSLESYVKGVEIG